MAFSPDGGRLASGSDDGTVRLWDAQRAAAISQLKLGAKVEALVWGPAGITVASEKSVIQLEFIDRPDAYQPDRGGACDRFAIVS